MIPLHDPPADVLDALSPAPHFPSRSILTRAFLEQHVAPLLEQGDSDLLSAIFQATREELRWKRSGKSLVLDVLRRRRTKRIGMERTFTTFLRCARIPARFVEGINLRKSTKRKRVFWTELWAQDAWWPVSVSQQWIGEKPAAYVALSASGRRMLQLSPELTGTYAVQAHRLPSPTPSVTVEGQGQ